MIIGLGIDLVKSKRIRDAVTKWDKRFLDRIFTPPEQEYAFAHRSPYLHLAGRFAVKEAVFKALGIGWNKGVRWTEISVVNDSAEGREPGRPRVETTGAVKSLMGKRGVQEVQVSISHDTDYSVAQVLLIGRDPG